MLGFGIGNTEPSDPTATLLVWLLIKWNLQSLLSCDLFILVRLLSSWMRCQVVHYQSFLGTCLFPFQGMDLWNSLCMIIILQCHVPDDINHCSHYCESHVFIFCLQLMVPHENHLSGSLKKFGNSGVEVFLYGL